MQNKNLIYYERNHEYLETQCTTHSWLPFINKKQNIYDKFTHNKTEISLKSETLEQIVN